MRLMTGGWWLNDANDDGKEMRNADDKLKSSRDTRCAPAPSTQAISVRRYQIPIIANHLTKSV
eukprot:scaffold9174_cov139-Isochrysis_galbana.AAC.2